MDYETLMKQVESASMKGVYVFQGEEEYLKEEALTKIEGTLLPIGLEALNETILDGPDIAQVYESAMAVPFMCDKRLIVAKDPPFILDDRKKDDAEAKPEDEGKRQKKEKTGSDIAEKLRFLNEDNPTAVVILYVRSSIERTKARNWLPPEKIVLFDALKEEQLTDRVKGRCEELGLSIETVAARELIASCANDLNAILRELDKLIDYKGGKGKITSQDVHEMVPPDVESSVFRMIDALIEQNQTDAYRILDALFMNNYNSVSILSVITRQLRQLCFVKLLSESNLSINEIQDRLGFKYSFQVTNSLKQAKKLSAKKLSTLYKRAVEYETLIKTGKAAERQSLDAILTLINATLQKSNGTN